MLVNMSAALWMAAWYWWKGIERDARYFAAGFAATGLVALSGGLYLIFTWPLPGSYNVMFGEPSVMLGAILLAAALALARDWSLWSVGLLAMLAGVTAVLIGARILNLGLTQSAPLSAAGFCLTGLAGILTLPVAQWRNSKGLRIPAALAALLGGAIWLLTACMAYWAHIQK
jgi:putative membrane protein